MISYVSLLIAFVATAGAIPICNALVRKRIQREGAAAIEGPVTPRVAGAGIIAGVLIALFYLEPTPALSVAPLLAAMALVVSGAWLQRHLLKAQPGRNVDRWYLRESAAAVAAAALIFLPNAAQLPSFLLDGGLALPLAALVTPLALSLLGRPREVTPALPLGVALVQILMLTSFAAVISAGVASPAHGSAFPTSGFPSLALPTMGALMAALVYLCRTPWRAAGVITAGTGTRLCLGLLVAWGALRLRGDLEIVYERDAVLLWILAVPVFEIVRRCSVAIIDAVVRSMADGVTSGVAGGIVPSVPVSPEYQRVVMPSASPLVIVGATLAAGLVGLVLAHLQVSYRFSVFGLLPAMLIYLSAPMLVQARNRASPHGIAVARR